MEAFPLQRKLGGEGTGNFSLVKEGVLARFFLHLRGFNAMGGIAYLHISYTVRLQGVMGARM